MIAVSNSESTLLDGGIRKLLNLRKSFEFSVLVLLFSCKAVSRKAYTTKKVNLEPTCNS